MISLLKRILGKNEQPSERPPVQVNITESTNEWNKLALAMAARDRLSVSPLTEEQARQRQERVYAYNREALDYARKYSSK